MGDKGEGGVKILKKWATSFMDIPVPFGIQQSTLISEKYQVAIILSQNSNSNYAIMHYYSSFFHKEFLASKTDEENEELKNLKKSFFLGKIVLRKLKTNANFQLL